MIKREKFWKFNENLIAHFKLFTFKGLKTDTSQSDRCEKNLASALALFFFLFSNGYTLIVVGIFFHFPKGFERASQTETTTERRKIHTHRER